MWLALVALALGTLVFALCVAALAGRVQWPGVALPGTRVLLGAASAAGLLAGHACVVLAVWADAGPARLDAGVSAWFVEHRDPAVTTAMHVASTVGDSPPTTVVVLLVVVGLWWRRRPATAIAAAVATLGSPLVSSGFKRFYDRPRPPLEDHLVTITGSSMPSGHTFNAVVVAGVLAVAVLPSLRRSAGRAVVGVVAVAATAAVGISRIYLGAHWLTDVLAGWMLGGAWLAACLTVTALLDRPGPGPAGPGPRRELVAAS